MKEATGAKLTLDGTTLTVEITSDTVSGTGTMDLVSTLVNTHGYTVTVTKNGDTYTLTGNTGDDAAIVEDLLPGNNGTTTLTVTIENDGGFTAEYTVVVSKNIAS